MDIEKIASETPDKIITTKIEIKENISQTDIDKIILPFDFDEDQKNDANKLINALYKIMLDKDATLIEINPLIITKNKKILCLDAKMNFDDNAILGDLKF